MHLGNSIDVSSKRVGGANFANVDGFMQEAFLYVHKQGKISLAFRCI
jgi:hypothetical protein